MIQKKKNKKEWWLIGDFDRERKCEWKKKNKISRDRRNRQKQKFALYFYRIRIVTINIVAFVAEIEIWTEKNVHKTQPHV